MTRIIVTGHGRIAALAIATLLRESGAMVLGTGSITMKTNEPDLQAFNWPEPAHISPTSNTGRRVAQWKSETRGRRS